MRYLISAICAVFGAMILSACSKAPERPVVMMETTAGNIEIEVYTDKAPISANDFLLYVDKKYYNGEGFYRVVRADNDPRNMGMSLIQGGRLDSEPLTDPIAHELTKDTGLSNTEGVVSIARLEPGTGSAAYFFINIGDNSFLDYGGERNPDGQG
jgi:peptidyl-prolyl cis-trans isomerase A (cyclophilin A)